MDVRELLGIVQAVRCIFAPTIATKSVNGDAMNCRGRNCPGTC